MFERPDNPPPPAPRKSNQRKTKVDYINKAKLHAIDWLKHKQAVPIIQFSNARSTTENAKTTHDAPLGTMQCSKCGGMAQASEVSIKISISSNTGYSITCSTCKIAT